MHACAAWLVATTLLGSGAQDPALGIQDGQVALEPVPGMEEAGTTPGAMDAQQALVQAETMMVPVAEPRGAWAAAPEASAVAQDPLPLPLVAAADAQGLLPRVVAPAPREVGSLPTAAPAKAAGERLVSPKPPHTIGALKAVDPTPVLHGLLVGVALTGVAAGVGGAALLLFHSYAAALVGTGLWRPQRAILSSVVPGLLWTAAAALLVLSGVAVGGAVTVVVVRYAVGRLKVLSPDSFVSRGDAPLVEAQ